jgi:hypothetical protein
MFVQQNDPYFKTNGFFERSIVKRVGLRGLLSRRYLVAANMRKVTALHLNELYQTRARVYELIGNERLCR